MIGQLFIAVCATRVIVESDIMQEFLSSSEIRWVTVILNSEGFNW